MEALVRWRDETGSLVPPSSFIPLAEESGLILPIGEWVLYEALRQTAAWRSEGHELVVSVNLSARQFRDREVERLVPRALEALAFPPSALELEITESVAMSDIVITSDIMHSIAERGVRFSLDDFGTGYSSFSYIKRLPIHCLKIDQSFVREIGAEAKTETAIGQGRPVYGAQPGLRDRGRGACEETPAPIPAPAGPRLHADTGLLLLPSPARDRVPLPAR